MARSKVGRVVGKLVFDTGLDCWIEVDPVEVDKAHDLAVAADFAVNSYIVGTKPRRFNWKGEEMDLADFAIVTAHELGWTGRVMTFYRKLDAALIDAGHRVREYSSRSPAGKGTGTAKMPTAIRELEG